MAFAFRSLTTESAVMYGNSDSETLTELGTANEWIISWGFLTFLVVTFTF